MTTDTVITVAIRHDSDQLYRDLERLREQQPKKHSAPR